MPRRRHPSSRTSLQFGRAIVSFPSLRQTEGIFISRRKLFLGRLQVLVEGEKP
jgi:hypothetical protein